MEAVIEFLHRHHLLPDLLPILLQVVNYETLLCRLYLDFLFYVKHAFRLTFLYCKTQAILKYYRLQET
jgi:hypothetical protein